jgi:hypothetical protein
MRSVKRMGFVYDGVVDGYLVDLFENGVKVGAKVFSVELIKRLEYDYKGAKKNRDVWIRQWLKNKAS